MERRNFIKLSALSVLPINKVENTLNFPSKEEKNLVFLFQGDSITDGNRGRNTDPNHIMGHGYAFAIASRIGADFPEAGFTFYNRGISGNKITDLQKRWQTDTLAIKPDVLSVLMGINDVNAVVNQSNDVTTIEQFETIYRDLLTDCQRLNPNMILVLGLPFAYPVATGRTKDKWALWQEETSKRQAIVRKLATEFKAILIDYPALFDKIINKPTVDYWIWDGIHPTVFAHELMARLWLKEVRVALRFLKKYK